MITEQTNSENPSLHWKYINCNKRVALDLGCGRWEIVAVIDLVHAPPMKAIFAEKKR